MSFSNFIYFFAAAMYLFPAEHFIIEMVCKAWRLAAKL